MKILFLTFYYKPDLCAGSFRSTALVEELANNKNIQLDIVTTMPNRYSTFSAEAKEIECNGNVTIHRVSLPSHKSGVLDQAKAFVVYYLKARKIAQKGNYDLIFATSSRLFTAFLGARVARKSKVPLYLDVRDIFLDTIHDIFSKKVLLLLSPVISKIESYAFNNAKHINLVSEGFKKYFCEKFTCQSYSYYTNGIDKEFIKYVKATSHDSNQKVDVVYAGNIGEGQGLHRIIPMLAKELKATHSFLIVGDGGKKSDLVNATQGMDNVKIVPPVSRDELVDVYKKSDILFLHLNDYPAFEKVLPSKIFEYAALGKPIWAGVSGYAATFLHQEIENVAVFKPLDHKGAVEKLNGLEMRTIERKSFIGKYNRQAIMKSMANTILDMDKAFRE